MTVVNDTGIPLAIEELSWSIEVFGLSYGMIVGMFAKHTHLPRFYPKQQILFHASSVIVIIKCDFLQEFLVGGMIQNH